MVEHSKEERRNALSGKVPPLGERIAMLVIIVIIFVSLGYGTYYSIIYNVDLFITAILIIVLIFMIPMSMLLKDTVFYKGGG